MFSARTRTQTARPGGERTNHGATALPESGPNIKWSVSGSWIDKRERLRNKSLFHTNLVQLGIYEGLRSPSNFSPCTRTSPDPQTASCQCVDCHPQTLKSVPPSVLAHRPSSTCTLPSWVQDNPPPHTAACWCLLPLLWCWMLYSGSLEVKVVALKRKTTELNAAFLLTFSNWNERNTVKKML